MPFNAQGLLQRMHKWKNDYNNGIKIIASRMDEDTDSIVDGINNILQGQTKFLGQIKTIFGTRSKPSFSFSDETDTGMYRPAPRQLGLSVGGNEKINVAGEQTTVKGNMTVNGNMDVTGQLELDWENQNNKGHNSNIDADKLDGQHGTYYTDPNNLSQNIPASKLSGSYGISITGNAATANNATNATNANNSSRLGGQTPSFYQNAENINAGILNPQRLSGTYDISVRGDVTAGRLGPNATHGYPQTERNNGWFYYTYSRGAADAPFNQSGQFVFFNSFADYNNGRQKGFFPQNGEINGVIPEFERLQVNGSWTTWKRIPKSSQDIASLMPPQGINTVQAKTNEKIVIVGEKREVISELNTSITPIHRNSRIKIDVNLTYTAHAIGIKQYTDALIALCRNYTYEGHELYKRNLVVQNRSFDRRHECLSFSYIDSPGTTRTVDYKIVVDKLSNIIEINNRLKDYNTLREAATIQYSSVTLLDLGPPR